MGTFIGDSLFLCFTVLGEMSEGLCVPSSGFLNPFSKLKTQTAESWDSRGAGELAPGNLVKRPFTHCRREIETGTEKAYRLPWCNNNTHLRIYVFLCSPGTHTQFLTTGSTFFELTVYQVLF